jgi:hypothetical protein
MNRLAALKGTSMEKQGMALRSHYLAEQAKADQALARTEAIAAAKQGKLDEAAQEESRKEYAKTLQSNLLDEYMNADVDAIGSRHTTLRVKYALADKVWAHRITNSPIFQERFQDMRTIGFKKFQLTDGYDFLSQWDLER